MLFRDLLPFTEMPGPFNHIFQFAGISRPVIAAQHRQRRGG